MTRSAKIYDPKIYSTWAKLRTQLDASKARRLREAALAKRPNIASHGLAGGFSKKELAAVQWVVVGVPDDRGIVNNYGRPGAAQGPEAFRNYFYRHPMAEQSPSESSILDLGDLELDRSLEKTLFNLSAVVASIYALLPGVRVLVVGGGHDIAFGEISGGLSLAPGINDDRVHHIVNFDAHCDMRTLEEGKIVTSGTPFYRLLKLRHPLLHGTGYHPFGLQRTTNSQELVDRMREFGVDSHWLEMMPALDHQTTSYLVLLRDELKNQPWHQNVDLDCFPFDIAPGVSAPQPFGLHPNIFLALQRGNRAVRNLMSLGIYELSPPHDESGKTARLAAKIAYYYMSLTEGKRQLL